MRERAHVASSAESTTTDYAWTGARLAAMRVTHASETTGGVETSVTHYRYLYGRDSLPLEMIVTTGGGAPVSYAFQCDRAGSVVALTDHSGAVVASYAYDPYGRLLSTGGSDPALAGTNPLRYRGYIYDEATGHYYLPARYYDPATARFLSVDPAPPVAGDPLTLNRYAYCVGDPINASDPTGAVIDVDGDGRIDSEDTISQSYIRTPSSSPLKAKRRAKMVAAVKAAQVREVAVATYSTVTVESGLERAGDTVTQLSLGWSAEDLSSVESQGLAGDGGKVVLRTAFSLPAASWLLTMAGGMMIVYGAQITLLGAGVTATGVGAPVGGAGVIGGVHLMVIGAGLVGAGLTAAEAETGINVVPWYER